MTYRKEHAPAPQILQDTAVSVNLFTFEKVLKYFWKKNARKVLFALLHTLQLITKTPWEPVGSSHAAWHCYQS